MDITALLQHPHDRPRHPRQHAPVRAELEHHDDPGDDAEPEGEAGDLEPELEGFSIVRIRSFCRR